MTVFGEFLPDGLHLSSAIIILKPAIRVISLDQITRAGTALLHTCSGDGFMSHLGWNQYLRPCSVKDTCLRRYLRREMGARDKMIPK